MAMGIGVYGVGVGYFLIGTTTPSWSTADYSIVKHKVFFK